MFHLQPTGFGHRDFPDAHIGGYWRR